MLRRDFVMRSGSSALLTLCPCASHAASKATGCRLRKASAGEERPPRLVPGSGVAAIDALCKGEVDRLNVQFGVKPAFGFFDDTGAENAYAVFDKARPAGAVLMGIELAKSISARAGSSGALILIGIMAHEWAHIYQYQIRYKDDWGIRWELPADYMAGWYLAKTKAGNATLREEIAKLFLELGDSDFANPDHHGSPKQRSNVLLHGAGLINGDRPTPTPAGSAGEAFRYAVNLLG